MKDCETSIEIPPASVVILDKSTNNGSQLPARATRLLTRRLQNNATPTNCGTGGSDSPRSMDSLPRRTALSAAYKTATLNQFNNNNADSASTATNSAEDLTLLDKSLRNSMLQDVVHFKKQLVRLRRILQETDTLNPFENNNGQFFTTATTTTTSTASLAGVNGELGATSVVDSKQQENTLIKESGVVALALLEDQRQELADLRRQVVYLQGEITAKDRTIRQQQNLIEKYEAEREKLQAGLPVSANGTAGNGTEDKSNDTTSTATQTERLRPLSFGGQDGLASAVFRYLPYRSLFVTDFFPIRNCTDFERSLVNRTLHGLGTIICRFYCSTCRMLSYAPDLINRLLTPRTDWIDSGFVATRMGQKLSNHLSVFMIALIRFNTIIMAGIHRKFYQIRYSLLCFYRLFVRKRTAEQQTELDT